MSEYISNDIHEVRKHERITQKDLAQKIGVTRQTIIAIEKGNYTPSLLLALKIAHFFDQPIEKLFHYHEK